MAQRLRVVHYLNQFFGGIGGEAEASVRPQVKDGAVGPGSAVQDALKEQGEVVATVICGDNYFAGRMDRATQEVIELLTPYQPEIVIAGPAFNTERYGVACSTICKAVQDKLGIPAVTGMYEGNPGAGLHKKDIYIIKTADSARGMADAVSTMVNLALKLATKQEIGRPGEEGYIPQGILKWELSDRTSAQRSVDMLLAKLQGKPFETELHLPEFERVKPADPVKNLSSAKIALVTDGGLVPKGNPDKIEFAGATKFGKYSIKGVDRLNPEDYEVVHIGYDPAAVRQDPHRLVPLDVMRDLEKEKAFGKLNENFYATTGVATPLENARKMGQGIAEELKAEGMDGVILTST
jgi:betaine reductase